MKLWQTMPIGKKLQLAFSSIAVLFLLFGWFMLNTVGQIKVKGPLYSQIIDKKDLIADILPPPAYIIEGYLYAMEIATAQDDPATRERLLNRLEELYSGSGYYRDRMQLWQQTLPEQQIREVFLGDARQSAEDFFASALGDFARAVRNGQMAEAREIFFSRLKPNYEKHRAAIDRVVELSNTRFQEIEADAENELRWRQYVMFVFFGVVVTLSLLLGFFIARSISRPINTGVRLLDSIAGGDLSRQVPENLLSRGDEVGNLCRSLQTMIASLRNMVQELSSGVTVVDGSALELTAVSQTMTAGADETSTRTNTVAAAAREMSVKISSVAAATDQAAGNVGMVAASTEEMTATINEISQNTETARAISEKAVNKSRSASQQIDELGKAADEVGKVTDTITEISEMTNLLALNATIEAARAGEAGKGFAVVANEIKELARQTAAATMEIKQRIEGIQGTTAGAIREIEGVSGIIVEVNSMVAMIAAAVEEQSVTTREIAGNIGQASQGIREITAKASESSTVAEEMASDIALVHQATSEISATSSSVDLNVTKLTEMVVKLKEIVARFRM